MNKLEVEKSLVKINELDMKLINLRATIANEEQLIIDEKKKHTDVVNEYVKEQAASDLKGKDYGCGTSNIDLGLFKAKVVVSKKVKWDESRLVDISKMISDAGEVPSDYIKTKLSVSEADYKNFSKDIQKVFISARTVESSTPKITIERKEVK